MVKAEKQPVVMTIAGFDPSGGAGVLADIKTISAFGCYGVAVITSITFQNTEQVVGVEHQSADAVRRQLAALFDDFEIAAVKTGMLPTAEIVQEVTDAIKAQAVRTVVVDPVFTSSSGDRLADELAIEAMVKHLFPLASLVTPNAAEASRITKIETLDKSGIERAAQAILSSGAKAVLITGGDAGSDQSSDLLVDSEGAAVYEGERIKSRHTHGTGCTFASAIAGLLARGRSLRESVPIAKRYINEAILNAPGLGRGHGPLNHFSVFEI
ncbi:MAG TPA: bifunctional hydroxymethylpyrimidine kinase/phosphomethylpyrimidine kinase [Blastocatellia bacterium]